MTKYKVKSRQYGVLTTTFATPPKCWKRAQNTSPDSTSSFRPKILHSSTPKCVSSKHCAVPVALLMSPPHKLVLPLLEQSEKDGTPSLGWHSKSTDPRVKG